jgi:hypothetical protein
MGTSLPNFSQAGGGVEVCFSGGAVALPTLPHEMDLG